MMPPSDPPYKLEVSRADLAQALKTVARAISKHPGDASLRFEDGCLSIEVGNTSADAPARGTWPLPIFVSAWWARRVARRMPAGDPIRLRADAGRLYANRYSEACSGTPREQPAPTEQSAIDENVLISAAAWILKPLRVERPAVESLVSEALARGTASWSVEEKQMMAIVAKAWALLAPMGVETRDIRRLVDNAVRNAWK
jgi:hypothetical protein